MKTEPQHQQRPIGESEIKIGDSFVLNTKKKLGGGAFGTVYQGYNIYLNQEVAIKLEKTKIKHPQLLYENKIYKILERGQGIPSIYWYGTQGNFNILIMDSLGSSLEDLFQLCSKKFTLSTTLHIASQLIDRIEFIHSKYFIHRDIKPDNFLIGKGANKNTIYAIDFGLAKKYKDFRTGVHIPYKDGKNLTGTARYASLNTHLGIEQARRDDIEAIGYIMVYFLKGKLPWQGLKAKNKKEKYDKIKEVKVKTELKELCSELPEELVTFINYARELKFEEKPKYDYLREIIADVRSKHGLGGGSNVVFDWDVLMNQQKQKEEGLFGNGNNCLQGQNGSGNDNNKKVSQEYNLNNK